MFSLITPITVVFKKCSWASSLLVTLFTVLLFCDAGTRCRRARARSTSPPICLATVCSLCAPWGRGPGRSTSTWIGPLSTRRDQLMGQPLPPPPLGTCYFVNPALTSYLFIYLFICVPLAVVCHLNSLGFWLLTESLLGVERKPCWEWWGWLGSRLI